MNEEKKQKILKKIVGLTKKIEIDPLNITAYIDRSIAKLKIGESEEAEKDFQQAKELIKDDKNPYINIKETKITYSYRDTKECKGLIPLYKDEAEFRLTLVMKLIKEKYYKEAIMLAKDTVEIYPKYPFMYPAFALSMYKNKKYNEALKVYQYCLLNDYLKKTLGIEYCYNIWNDIRDIKELLKNLKNK